jgi:hypothetical protein
VTSNPRLELPAVTHSELMAHLLPVRSKSEEAAFIFSRCSLIDGRIRECRKNPWASRSKCSGKSLGCYSKRK